MKKQRILCVVGARPNFMKIAPIIRAFNQPEFNLSPILLHTGQHYDMAMKGSIFQQLNIPEPDIDLGVGTGSHAIQTAEIMRCFEPIVDELKPRAVLVVGDVNSTLACALVAAKKNIPVIHVEAGLRSNDRTMPEEVNRVLTDQISDLLFTTEESAESNLWAEGISAERVHFVGNVMIDTLKSNLSKATPAVQILESIWHDLSLFDKGFALLTLHRPSNVDDPEVLTKLITLVCQVSKEIPIVFPIHPRTRQRIQDAGLKVLIDSENITVLPPQGYLEILGLMKEAKIVLTDSGGIQEETTALGVPCVTLRESTERPITCEQGTNTIVGTDSGKILNSIADILQTGGKVGRIPKLWDGHAAQRIAAIVDEWAATEADADALLCE